MKKEILKKESAKKKKREESINGKGEKIKKAIKEEVKKRRDEKLESEEEKAQESAEVSIEHINSATGNAKVDVLLQYLQAKMPKNTPTEWFTFLETIEKVGRTKRIIEKMNSKDEYHVDVEIKLDSNGSTIEKIVVYLKNKVTTELKTFNLKNGKQQNGNTHNVEDEEEAKKHQTGKFLAIDCEMVGTKTADGRLLSELARVSIVNFYGKVVMDKYVKPKNKVYDYRTWVSGIKPKHLQGAASFAQVQAEVKSLIVDKTLVGHDIKHDLKSLHLKHSLELIRDTSRYHHFRKHANNKTPGLKKLALLELGLKVQAGEHDSVDDALITMLLFRKVKPEWDLLVKKKARVKVKRVERAVG
ncbi:RNA exonuclease 4 [Zancudomyces culisetae]|uniref:RNA exonuclease 4 n=1 Tax=Zancudomyces culisetae TaxID=1213189 RepID=A0A1R1PR45_ZANCU|nr:RNA exonuclease 4 [Zancudomyces culisetae]|eukprot:OMH83411.1 RNA exonuclease 4 [Zancudomyces culisetae]